MAGSEILSFEASRERIHTEKHAFTPWEKKLRVLFPLSTIPFGGAEKSTIELINSLTRDVEAVVAIEDPHPSASNWIEKVLPPYVQLVHVKQFDTLSAKKLVKQQGIDIVHTNNASHHELFAGLRGCRFQHIVHQRNRGLPAAFRRSGMLLGKVRRKLTHVISISEFAKGTLPKYWGERASLVYNPIRIPVHGAPDGLDDSHVRLAYVGRDVGYKRVRLLPRIVNELNRLGFSVSLQAFGVSATSKHVLNESLGAGPNLVEVFEWHPNPWREIPRDSIILFPAVGEPFGRGLVESVCQLRPTIASYSGGHLESMISSTKWRFAVPDHPTDYALKVAEIQREGGPTTLEESAHANRMTRRHNPKLHAKSVQEIYWQLAS